MADECRVCGAGEENTIPTHILIAEYLKKVTEKEREELKIGIMGLCDELYKNDITVPIDFKLCGDTLYSETFNRDVMFLSSVGAIIEKSGSIVYEITDNGKKLLDKKDMNYKHVSPFAREKFEELLEKLPIE